MTVQRVIGKVASFGERIHYIFSFTDPIVTYVAMFVTVVFVLLASMALYALYNVAVYIGGRAIFFTLGSIAILPPRFSVFPWSLVRQCFVIPIFVNPIFVIHIFGNLRVTVFGLIFGRVWLAD